MTDPLIVVADVVAIKRYRIDWLFESKNLESIQVCQSSVISLFTVAMVDNCAEIVFVRSFSRTFRFFRTS